MFGKFELFKPKGGELKTTIENPKAPDIVPSFETLAKKFPFSKEELEKNDWLGGLEFGNYTASIKKGSPAENTFEKMIKNGGDASFKRVEQNAGEYYVFEKIEQKVETEFSDKDKIERGGFKEAA